MSRAPVGIYVDGNAVRFYGRRQATDPAGMAWHPIPADRLATTVAEASARALLDASDDFRLLRWDGSTVVRRTRAETDALELADKRSVDDGFFDGEHMRALIGAVVSEFNAANGTAVSADGVRATFKQNLGRP